MIIHSRRSFAPAKEGVRRVVLTAALLAPTTLLTSVSSAWLGGFEDKDGYQPFLNFVQNYNAGQYGLNSGYIAMSPSAITPNTGLWTALQGGFSSGGSISYATGHQFRDRTYVNSNNTMGLASDQALVLTTGHEGWGGPALKYRYNVDSQDLGGVAPSTTPGQVISLSFWVRGQLDVIDTSGSFLDGYYGNSINFNDSSGNSGFSLGLTNRVGGDKVTYWNGTSMFESTIIGGAGKFDQWNITLDLASQTVSASYFQFTTSTTYPLITGVPLMQTMNDFTNMVFTSAPGTQNDKNWQVDDFDLRAIPTPGTLSVVALGMVGVVRRRRR